LAPFSPSEKTCADALWCVYGPPVIDQASLVVEIDEHLADHCAVEEGDDPVLSVELSVRDEARDETLVKRTPIANRRPDILRARVDQDFLANTSHLGSPVCWMRTSWGPSTTASCGRPFR